MLIRTQLDVVALMREQSLQHPFRRPAALLELPQLSPAESAAWGGRLEYWRGQCGCTAAMIGLGAFTVTGLVYVFFAAFQAVPGTIEPDYPAILVNGSLFLAGLILSAMAGKFAGLAVAALRYRQTCRALQLRLEDSRT